MNKEFIKYSGLLLLLPILQIGIFNNINLLGYIDPYVYIIFVFVFPIKKVKTSILLSTFALGLFIDYLSNDGGIHAFSIVLIAFIRLFILKILTGKSDTDIEELNIKEIPFSTLFLWIAILTIIHHFIVFILEQFSISHFGSILQKTFLTATFSIVLIIFGIQLFLKRK
jgi:uncharacterized protein YacL